jgi:hypothetical protein
MRKALLVKDGKIERVELGGDYTEINRLIGCDFFTTCFHTTSPAARNRELTGFCDDEFLLHGSTAWNVAIGRSLRSDGPYPIGNGIVITATNDEGETVSMTDAELDAFAIDESHGLLMMGPAGTALLPTLEFKVAA